MSEEALMRAYVAGDGAAFRRLFDRLAPSLHAFFARSVRNPSLAEDLMQTTFLRVHHARGRWRGEERLRPWVFTIAAHVRLDWLRRQGRAAEDPSAELDDLPELHQRGDPAAQIAAQERAERVQAALDCLSEPQRVVVHLHRFEGLTFGEIGRVLGVSEGAAKLRAFRAYEALRRMLADLVAEGDR